MKKYYVIQTDSLPDEQPGQINIDPNAKGFDSIKEAEAFIRKDSLQWMEGGEHELGVWHDLTDTYLILELKQVIQPEITVKASVTLKRGNLS